MAESAPASSTINLLNACIQRLGVAILPIWGVTENGFCRCPAGAHCESPGKHPNGKLVPNGVHGASRDLSIVRQWLKAAPRGNWALRCGDPLPGGGFLGVLDHDPRNGSIETLNSILGPDGELPHTVSAVSGGEGGHHLFRFPHSPLSRSAGPGLDLQGGGKYIVIAPSLHRSGGVYAWELGCSPDDAIVAEAPQWLLEGTEQAVPRPVPDGGTARETVLGEAFVLSGRAGPVMPNGVMYVNCVQSNLHSDARGRGEDDSTVILPPAGGSRFGGYACRHGHCANLKWDQVLKLLPEEHVRAAKAKYPILAVVPDPPEPPETLSAIEVINRVYTPEEQLERDIKTMAGRIHMKSDGKGQHKVINDIINANIILTHDPRWKGLLRFDEFAQQLRFTRTPPFHPDDTPKGVADCWQDVHVTCLDLWFRRTWAFELSTEKIRESVYVVGKRDSYNPLQDYLSGVQWDGTPRLDGWLPTYLGATDNQYTRIVGRKWILSAVARAFQPGCAAHHVLILEGPQGKGKSTAAATLVPNREWFGDTPLDLGSKDAYVQLRGKFIIELAELASLKKADLDRVKSFFTSPVDSYRPPYGRELVAIPRTCVFVGTVNLGQYLVDETGARRFWPVRCGVIDTKQLAEDRDQLWAEAVHIYKDWVKRGSPVSDCLWWPSLEETSLFEAEQAERELQNPWQEAIALWINSERARGILKHKKCLSTRDIAHGALSIEDRDINQKTVADINTVMSRDLKWTKKRVMLGTLRCWAYVPT